MKSLKDYIEKQDFIGSEKYTDLDIICDWFIENNKEYIALSLIPKLAQEQSEKIQRKYDWARSQIPMIDAIFDSFEQTEANKNFRAIAKMSVLDLDLRAEKDLFEWAKSYIPKHIMPCPFYTPSAPYLAKYGLQFKEKKVSK